MAETATVTTADLAVAIHEIRSSIKTMAAAKAEQSQPTNADNASAPAPPPPPPPASQSSLSGFFLTGLLAAVPVAISALVLLIAYDGKADPKVTTAEMTIGVYFVVCVMWTMFLSFSSAVVHVLKLIWKLVRLTWSVVRWICWAIFRTWVTFFANVVVISTLALFVHPTVAAVYCTALISWSLMTSSLEYAKDHSPAARKRYDDALVDVTKAAQKLFPRWRQPPTESASATVSVQSPPPLESEGSITETEAKWLDKAEKNVKITKAEIKGT